MHRTLGGAGRGTGFSCIQPSAELRKGAEAQHRVEITPTGTGNGRADTTCRLDRTLRTVHIFARYRL